MQDPAITKSEIAAAAGLLRELLDEIKAGELEASTPREVALLRRLEGALIALEEASKPGD